MLPTTRADFARSAFGVCKTFQPIVTELWWKSVVVSSHNQLVKLATDDGVYSSLMAAHTLRLSVRFDANYDPALLQRVLAKLPRLCIFQTETFGQTQTTNHRQSTGSIASALVEHCGSLEAAQFDSPREPLPMRDVALLLRECKDLKTLHVVDLVPWASDEV
jgi:hypothetical protein